MRDPYIVVKGNRCWHVEHQNGRRIVTVKHKASAVADVNYLNGVADRASRLSATNREQAARAIAMLRGTREETVRRKRNP